MRFHFGAVPESPDFSPDASWKPMREPRPWLIQFIALPIGIVTTAFVWILWDGFTPVRLNPFTMELVPLVALCLGLPVVHELIHAALHPGAGRSSRTILGVWPKCGMFYAYYDGELSRNRLVAIALMPLFVMTILPLVVSAALGSASEWVAFVSCLNALCASGDVLVAGMFLFQVPPNATLRNQGWKTYWREHEELCQVPC